MNKNILIPLFTFTDSCISDVNDPIVRFWNDGIRPSESKMSEIKNVLIRLMKYILTKEKDTMIVRNM